MAAGSLAPGIHHRFHWNGGPTSPSERAPPGSDTPGGAPFRRFLTRRPTIHPLGRAQPGSERARACAGRTRSASGGSVNRRHVTRVTRKPEAAKDPSPRRSRSNAQEDEWDATPSISTMSHSARQRIGAPGHRGCLASSSSSFPRSEGRSRCNVANARSKSLCAAEAARSRSVRAGTVIGTPSKVVFSSLPRTATRRTRTDGLQIRRLRRMQTSTDSPRTLCGSNPHRPASLR